MVAEMDNNANQDILEVIEIDGLIKQINEHLKSIVPKTTEQQLCKINAREAIANFQKDELFALRGAFE